MNNANDPESVIRSRVAVTRQKVMMAKAVVYEAALNHRSWDDLLTAVYEANSVVVPRPVCLHESVDIDAQLTAVANAISWRLATIEAIWSLVHSGLLISMGDVSARTATVAHTTIPPGGGSGMSGGWTFEEYALPAPSRVRRSPSSLADRNEFLSEPDLYLRSLDVSGMHADVAGAFAEAVRCFGHGLFTASLAMLGKASEGAWLELGAALVALIPASEQSRYAKPCAMLEDSMAGPYRKVEAVLAIFDHQDRFGDVARASGVKPKDLRPAAVWSDAVRDSRNTIHFGVAPAVPNTYEKVAALLLGAVPNVRLLYRLKNAADAAGGPT